jgi:hypothetical protein
MVASGSHLRQALDVVVLDVVGGRGISATRWFRMIERK